VCLGNICRSPLHKVFLENCSVKNNRLFLELDLQDTAGSPLATHLIQGHCRAQKMLGIDISHKSRQVTISDLMSMIGF